MNQRNEERLLSYFLMIDYRTKKEIGSIIYHCNVTIDDFKAIMRLKEKVIMTLESVGKNTILKHTLDNHYVIGRLVNDEVYYFIVFKKGKGFSYYKNKNIVDFLIKIIENQKIRKMITTDGELSIIGRKTLVFALENNINNYKVESITINSIKENFRMNWNKIKTKFISLINRIQAKLMPDIKEEENIQMRLHNQIKFLNKLIFWLITITIFMIIKPLFYSKINNKTEIVS